MSDVLSHYHMYDYHARCAVAITTEITREAQKRHQLDPLTTIAVGRAIGCATLLASTLKLGDQYVHCMFSGDGPLRKVIGECNGDGHCRGYSVPHQIALTLGPGQVPPTSVGEAFGGPSGSLTVTRGKPGQEPYHAICNFMNGEIASDMARYLTESEQIPSAVAAGVKLSPTGEVLAAGAVLFQKLAGTELDERAIADVEKRMSAKELAISDRIARGESTDALVAYLQGAKTGFGVLTTRSLTFKCTCSREKMAGVLMAMGRQECEEIYAETGKLEMRCAYCAEVHTFSLSELIIH